MYRIANLKIDPIVFANFPESLVRECCVLPISEVDGRFHVVLGRRPDYRDIIEKIQFVLNREIICAVADYQRIEKAIDEIFSFGNTEVKNCPIDFRVPCPRRWLELRPTGQSDVRFCDECQLPVYLSLDEGDAIRQASLGRCVAIYRAVEYEPGFAMGLIEFIE